MQIPIAATAFMVLFIVSEFLGEKTGSRNTVASVFTGASPDSQPLRWGSFILSLLIAVGLKLAFPEAVLSFGWSAGKPTAQITWNPSSNQAPPGLSDRHLIDFQINWSDYPTSTVAASLCGAKVMERTLASPARLTTQVVLAPCSHGDLLIAVSPTSQESRSLRATRRVRVVIAPGIVCRVTIAADKRAGPGEKVRVLLP